MRKHRNVLSSRLLTTFSNAGMVLTMGGNGVNYVDLEKSLFVPSEKVTVCDTTGAADSIPEKKSCPRWASVVASLPECSNNLEVMQKSSDSELIN